MLLVCAAGVSACAGGVSPRGRAPAPDPRCRYCKKMLPILDRVRATYPERVQTFYKW